MVNCDRPWDELVHLLIHQFMVVELKVLLDLLGVPFYYALRLQQRQSNHSVRFVEQILNFLVAYLLRKMRVKVFRLHSHIVDFCRKKRKHMLQLLIKCKRALQILYQLIDLQNKTPQTNSFLF